MMLNPLLLLASIACVSACASSVDRQDFTRETEALTKRGLMKTDRRAREAPFTAERLANNFYRLAFGAEFTLVDGRYTPLPANNGTALKRWAGPVEYRVSGRVRPSDLAHIAEIGTRIETATGLPIVATEATPALEIRFLDEDDREFLVENLANSPLRELAAAWSDTPAWPCASEFYSRPASDPQAHEIIFATIYIRDELDGLARRACIEEEIAQTLGLARDDRTVRPSIFNDDDEYALLTDHDALLLRILYDPSLRPGMRPDEAMPLVRLIARNVHPEKSASSQ